MKYWRTINMTFEEYKNQINILKDVYQFKLTQKVLQDSYSQFKNYPHDLFKQVVRKIYSTITDIKGKSVFSILKEQFFDDYGDPEEQIKLWLSVIKHQKIYEKPKWEAKPPKVSEITCLKKMPDPTYWQIAVGQWQEGQNQCQRK